MGRAEGSLRHHDFPAFPWPIAWSAMDKTTSNRASTNTNLNSSSSASNGSKKSPITQSSTRSRNFHHQFLERGLCQTPVMSGHRSRSGDIDEPHTMEIITLELPMPKGVSASAEEEPNNERDV
jgi:hypothetical protein